MQGIPRRMPLNPPAQKGSPMETDTTKQETWLCRSVQTWKILPTIFFPLIRTAIIAVSPT
jgi:hypothetical protein